MNVCDLPVGSRSARFRVSAVTYELEGGQTHPKRRAQMVSRMVQKGDQRVRAHEHLFWYAVSTLHRLEYELELPGAPRWMRVWWGHPLHPCTSAGGLSPAQGLGKAWLVALSTGQMWALMWSGICGSHCHLSPLEIPFLLEVCRCDAKKKLLQFVRILCSLVLEILDLSLLLDAISTAWVALYTFQDCFQIIL